MTGNPPSSPLQGTTHEDSGDWRGGLHRLCRGAPCGGAGARGREPGRDDLCRERGERGAGGKQPRLCVRACRHPRPRGAGPHLCPAPARRRDAPCRRKPRRPLDRRPRRVRRDERQRHLQHAGSRPRLLDERGQARGISLPPHLDRRGVRIAGRDRAVHRGHALRSAQPLFGVQGRVRPPGPRLARDLWPAGRADQLLEQLRPLPLPREAGAGGDPARAGGPADPGLRRRRQRARLALRRGSRRRAASVPKKGREWAQLQHRRRERGQKHRPRPHDLRASG